MKKTLGLIICALLSLLMLAGCAGNSASPDPDGASASPSDGVSAEKPSRGEWTSDNVYKNEYAGLTFNMPDGWTAATDDEIAQLMGLSADLMSEAGMQFTEKMLELQVINDALIRDSATGSSVIVTFENLGLVVGGSKTTEDEYLDIMKESLNATELTSYSFGDSYEEKIGRESYRVLKADAAEFDMVQYIYVRKQGSYMIDVIVTVMGTDDIANIMSNFS